MAMEALKSAGSILFGLGADYAIDKLKTFASKPADDDPDKPSSAPNPQGATGGADDGDKARSASRSAKPEGTNRRKGNMITNDTPRPAEIKISTGNGDTSTEMVQPRRSVRVGIGDGSDALTVRLLSKGKKTPKHLAVANKPLEIGEEYMITWNKKKKSAGIVLKKRGSSKLYYTYRGDKNIRPLSLGVSNAENEVF